MLVFLVGVIKNVERTLALYLSSLPRLRELMNPNVSGVKLHRLYEMFNALEDGYPDEEEAKLAESIVVKHAYYFFHTFKVFLADLIFTSDQRIESLEYFRKASPLDALRVISVELQFMYELLHTKALVIRSKLSYSIRFIASNILVVAFVLFNRLNKHGLPELDIKITYSLLLGGIALDMMALFKFAFSDWTLAKIKLRSNGSSKLDSFLHKLVSASDYLRKVQFATCEVKPNANDTYKILDTPLIFRRWSESICACNLFSELWEEAPRKMYKRDQGWGIISSSNICSFPFRVADNIISSFYQACETIAKSCRPRNTSLIVHTKYISKNPFIKELWIFIFKEGRRKSEDAYDPTKVRQIFGARGDLFLKSVPLEINRRNNLLKYVTKYNYVSSIVSWHIATELWYNRETPVERNEEREFSKILSDYMMYLLLHLPNVVFVVAGNAQFTIAETLAMLRENTRENQDVKGQCLQWLENNLGFRGS